MYTLRSFLSPSTLFSLWYQDVLRIDIVFKFRMCSVARGFYVYSVCIKAGRFLNLDFTHRGNRLLCVYPLVRGLDDPPSRCRAGCEEETSYGLVTVIPSSFVISIELRTASGSIYCFIYSFSGDSLVKIIYN